MRFLSHVETVHWAKRAVAVLAVLFAVGLGASYGVPAYAQVAATPPPPGAADLLGAEGGNPCTARRA